MSTTIEDKLANRAVTNTCIIKKNQINYHQKTKVFIQLKCKIWGWRWTIFLAIYLRYKESYLILVIRKVWVNSTGKLGNICPWRRMCYPSLMMFTQTCKTNAKSFLVTKLQFGLQNVPNKTKSFNFLTW